MEGFGLASRIPASISTQTIRTNSLLGLDSLQAESLSECIALEVDRCLPQPTGILDQYDSASELVRHAIDFGYVWAEQGQGAPPLVGQMAGGAGAGGLPPAGFGSDLAQNLQHYEFFPAAWTWPHTGGNLRSETA